MPDFPKEKELDSTSETTATKKLDKFLRLLSFEVFRNLIVYFEDSEVRDSPILLDIDIFKYSILEEKLKSDPKSYTFTECCGYCQMLDSCFELPLPIDQKYASESLRMNIFSSDHFQALELTKKISSKIPQLKCIRVAEVPVKFENSADFFSEMNSLNVLILEGTQLGEIPESLFSLKSLNQLHIKDNSVNILPNSFQALKSLKVLTLQALRLKESPPSIELPKKLTNLEVNSLAVNKFPFDLSKCAKSLTVLIFTAVEWIVLEQNEASTVLIGMLQLTKTFKHILTENQIKRLFHQFNDKKTGYLDQEGVTKLNAFVFKKFPRLGDDIEAKDLKNISGIPDSIFSLANLTYLDLSFQAIRFVPSEITNLKNLEALVLNNCILLENISSNISDIKSLNKIELRNCFSLKTPPPEICARGSVAILAYLKRLSTGSVQYKRTKLMLVGLGEAGKTSLVNSLMNKAQTHSRPDITDGIDIKNWVVDLPDNTSLTYSIWDFAGQSVYYNSHQFFLTSRAVYLLVWFV